MQVPQTAGVEDERYRDSSQVHTWPEATLAVHQRGGETGNTGICVRSGTIFKK